MATWHLIKKITLWVINWFYQLCMTYKGYIYLSESHVHCFGWRYRSIVVTSQRLVEKNVLDNCKINDWWLFSMGFGIHGIKQRVRNMIIHISPWFFLSPMMFTHDCANRKNHRRIASLVTKKMLYIYVIYIYILCIWSQRRKYISDCEPTNEISYNKLTAAYYILDFLWYRLYEFLVKHSFSMAYILHEFNGMSVDYWLTWNIRLP